MAREKLQKAFALLLTFSMSMSLLGVTAFADEPEAHTHNPVACPTCGGDHQIEVNVPCPDCGGTVAEVPMIDCAICGGTGTDYTWDFNHPCPVNGESCGGCDACFFGYERLPVTCEGCGGTG